MASKSKFLSQFSREQLENLILSRQEQIAAARQQASVLDTQLQMTIADDLDGIDRMREASQNVLEQLRAIDYGS